MVDVTRAPKSVSGSIDDIQVTATPSGSQIVYHANIEFRGLARLAGPLLQRKFEQIGDTTPEQMTRVLSQLAG